MSTGENGGSGLGALAVPGTQTNLGTQTTTTPMATGQLGVGSEVQVSSVHPQSQTGPGTGSATKAAAQKRPARRGGKPPPDRPVRALWCLSLKNPVRKLCIDIVEWKYPLCNNYLYESIDL